MATTTFNNTTSTTPMTSDRRSLYWGIAIAIILAIAVILTVRSTSNRDTYTTPVQAAAPAATVNTLPTDAQRNAAPVERNSDTSAVREPTSDVNIAPTEKNIDGPVPRQNNEPAPRD